MPVTGPSFFQTRRRLLTGILTLPLVTCGLRLNARGTESKQLSVIDRWHTGNHTLYPFLRQGDTLYLNGNSTLEAWDISTRQRRWSSKLLSSATYRPRCNSEFVVSCGRKQLSGFLRENGKLAWRYTPRSELGIPVITESHVYVGEGNILLAIEIVSGEIVWKFPILKNARIAYAPIEWNGVIYLGSGDGILYAIRAVNGELLWSIDREKDWQYLRQLHIDSGVLIAGGYHDELFGIDLDDGELQWRFNAGNFVNSHVVSKGMTYFWSPTGWIYALDSMVGEVIWRHRTNDFRRPANNSNWAPLMAELVTGESHLYALAMDNTLHVLDRETGDKTDEFFISEKVRPFICLGSNPGDLLFGSVIGDVLLANTV